MKETIIWIFLLICDGLIPVTALAGGLWLMKFAKRKKGGIGYYSRAALLSDETWRFAQSCCGMIWEMIGIATFVPSFMFGVFAYFADLKIQCVITLVLVAIQMVILWVGTMSVERAIKEYFDEEGRRKEREIIEEKEEKEEKNITLKEMIFGESDDEEEQ